MRLPAIAACLFAAAAFASEASDVLVWVPGRWEAGAHGERRWIDGYYVRGLVVDPPPAVPAPVATVPAPPPAAAQPAPAPQVVHHYYDRPVWRPSIFYGFSVAPGYGHCYSRHQSRFALSFGFGYGYPY